MSEKLVTTLDDLTQTLAESHDDHDSEQPLSWLITPDNWFEIVEAARSAVPRSFEPTIADEAGKTPLGRLALVDLVLVYEVLRDWSPQLSGPDRRGNVADGVYDATLAQLRELILACADRRPVAKPVAFALPGLAHELNTEPELATLFWKPLLTARRSPSLAAAASAYAADEEASEKLLERPWLRVLLQRIQVEEPGDPVEAALRDLYADPDARERLLDAERRCLAEVGLEQTATELADALGLEQSLRRSRPFALGRPKKLESAPEPTLTVLIPACDHEDFIEAAVDSVRAQTRDDLCILVVDDCSTDATVERARGISDPRLEVLVNEERLGLGNSIHAALKHIDTPYVAIVSADDVVHPKRFEKCLEALESNEEAQIVTTGVALVDEHGKRLTGKNASALLDGHEVADYARWFDRVKPGVVKPKKLFGELLQRNFLATCSNIVCRREFLLGQKRTLTSLAHCLEWQLFLDAARDGVLTHVSQDLVAYRLHANNRMWVEPEDGWRYFLEANRVAANAVRAQVRAQPAKSKKRVEAALRLVARHVKANTETDALGLYVSELVGANVLEQSCESSKATRKLLTALERAPDERAPDARDPDVIALEARVVAYRDELAGRREAETGLLDQVEDQASRIASESERLEEAERKLSEIQAKLDERTAELERREAELAAQNDTIAKTTAELAGAEARLARTVREHEAVQAERDTTEQDREQLLAELAARDEQMTSERARIDELAARCKDEAARRERAEMLLYEQRANERMAALLAATPAAQKVNKWRRKRVMFYARTGLKKKPKRGQRRVLLTGEHDACELRSLAELVEISGAARIDPVYLRWIDGALAEDPQLSLPKGVREARLFSYPDLLARAEQDWTGRSKLRVKAILEAVAESCGDPSEARRLVVPALFLAEIARHGAPQAMFATGFGPAAARVRIAAELLNCSWGLVLDTLDTRGDPLAQWLIDELDTAACVVARSQALADASTNEHAVVRYLPAHLCTSQTPEFEPIVSAARPGEMSGWVSLLEAMASPVLEGLEATLFLTGDPDSHRAMSFEEQVLAERERFGVRARVDLRWGVPARVSRDAIYVAAGYEADGPQPLAPELLDAMADGMAIIATDAACHGDAIVDGNNGIVVPAGDPTALGAAIARLNDSVELRARLGRRSREVYEKRFADDVTDAAFVKAIGRLLES